jgi:alpha-galactosidase
MDFIDLRQRPTIVVQTDSGFAPLDAQRDVRVELRPRGESVDVFIESPTSPVLRVLMRWGGTIPAADARILGDHWERGYGDLEWRCIVPERVMPWYTLVHAGGLTHAYGVQTQPAAMCWWRVDQAGITLCLDVRSGAAGVVLGKRQLHAATLVARKGASGESAFDAARAFCRMLCPNPRLPDHVVYGSNDWYYAYGVSSRKQILRDADIVVEHAPAHENRPYMVIDAGWQARATLDPWDGCCGGPWTHGNDRYGDMPSLAAEIRRKGARPGIWMRPLGAAPDTPASRLLNPARATQPSARVPVLDPSIDENLHHIERDVARLRQWGFDLIKHDWSACDLLGRWGFEMGNELTSPGWHLADRSKTNAEATLDLFRAIRRGAGDAVVIGCNTFSHLAAGIFELQRTGDDTSGRDWEKTRKMGPNTLAFRMPQHEAFYACDADCVGLTNAVPWELNAQWLDLLANSGTPLFVSTDPAALTPDRSAALKEAFARAAHPRAAGEPLDWLHTTCPQQWNFPQSARKSYAWIAPEPQV